MQSLSENREKFGRNKQQARWRDLSFGSLLWAAETLTTKAADSRNSWHLRWAAIEYWKCVGKTEIETSSQVDKATMVAVVLAHTRDERSTISEDDDVGNGLWWQPSGRLARRWSSDIRDWFSFTLQRLSIWWPTEMNGKDRWRQQATATLSELTS